eukprot:GHVS01062564.1.p1 GENE.GHVS01062564.1~~GHVS01062564.1.p1  ORF type:complete len:421 (+),score=59.99 GHVS01062564.1:373-1635(+)
MYKETFSSSFKAEARDGGGLQISKRPPASTSRKVVSRAPANTLNSKDGNARGRACSRYHVDADGRRVLRSGYELVASSTSDSNALSSTALPSRDGASSRSNEQASLTDSATARATDQAGEDSALASLLLCGGDETLNMPSVVEEECKLLAGKRASPLTRRCNLSLASLRSVSALQRTFSMSMYHYDGKRSIFLSCVQPVCQSDDEDDSTLATAADAANGNQIGDHLEVSGDRLNRDHKCKTAEAPRSNVMGNVLEDITEESRDDVEEVHNSSSVQNGRCDGTDKIPQIVGEPHPDPTGSPGEVPALGSRVTCGHSEPARAADSQTDIAPSACQRGEPVVVNEGDKSINDQAGIGRKDSDDEEDTAAENAEQEADAGILYWVPYGGNRFGERFVQMLHGHAYVHIGFLFVRLLRACLELQI